MTLRLARRSGLVLAILVAVLGVVSAVAPAQGTVRGEVKMVGEKPISGTYNLAYRNYSGKFCTDGSRPPYLCFVAYHVSRGTAAVKLRTYKLREGLHGYDYYIVDAEVQNKNPYGASTGGWMKVHIDKHGPVRIVDYSDTKSVSSTKSSCYSVSPSFGASVGPAGVSFSLGDITFCDDSASYPIDYRDGARTVWMAHNLRKIRSLVSERIVKVPAGKHPQFTITVHVPTDKCTDTRAGDCTEYTNKTLLKQYTIGTTG